MATPEAYLSLFGEVPEFAEKLTTMRKYEISCTIVIQSISQLKSRYKDSYETIIGGCDTIIFLGSSENDTCEYVSKLLGDTTVRTKNLSLSSKGGSSSFSYQKRPLRTPAEVKKLDNKECYVFIRGLDPFHVPKFSFVNHEHFKKTGHGGNAFTAEMMDQYFNLTQRKRNGLKGKQSASDKALKNTKVMKPESKKDVLEAVNSETVEEAKEKVTRPPLSEKERENLERDILGDGTEVLKQNMKDHELEQDEEGNFSVDFGE